ncbi:O-antigen/teichoic acid export membrane protein [Thermosipho japonicus]|uniref:O-antigen/teichoic acid export membrane protein n=1 Tax=Thermosipho japonicus TaxID=90323 RepID=A0A841GGR6_9BACT|nr:O-antigen/teichoic acid export membrane protein [Thermosipho japonicus]
MSIKKSGSILFASKVIKTIFDIASIMLLSRFLFISDYGIYRQVLISQQLVISILTLGIPNSALFYLSTERKKEYLTNLYVSLTSFSVLVLIISPFLADLFDANFKVNFFKNNVLIISLIYSLGIFSSATENILVALNRTKKLISYTLIPTFFWFLGLLFYLIFEKYTILNILVLLILRYIIGILLLISFTRKDINFRYLNLKMVREIVIFGVPIGLSTILGMLNKNVDKLVVGYFVDSVDFAIFSNGAYEIPFLSLLTSSLFTVLIPELKKLKDLDNVQKLKELWIRSGNIMVTLMIPIASSLIFFAKPFIVFIFSEKYLASIPYFRIYQIMLYFRIYVYGSIFVATKNNRLFLINAVYSLIFNLILDILLVIKLGPIGAVIATVLTTVFLVFLQLFNIKNILNIKFSETFPWINWFKSIVVTVGINSGFYIFYSLFSSNLLGLLFMFLSFVVSFLVLSKLVNNEILKYVFSVLKIINLKK